MQLGWRPALPLRAPARRRRRIQRITNVDKLQSLISLLAPSDVMFQEAIQRYEHLSGCAVERGLLWEKRDLLQ